MAPAACRCQPNQALTERSSAGLKMRAGIAGLLQRWYMELTAWTVVFVDRAVQEALDALPVDIRASFERIVNLIQSYGLERMQEPYVRHLEGPIWEMRLKGRDGIARTAYVTASGRRVVVVHVFGKKTQQTPRREIEAARRKAKEVR
jgi:phage-related protein